MYVFIQKDVFIENNTYRENLDTPNFKSAIVDDTRIHEFIIELKETVKRFPIKSFESVHDIIGSLRLQFAGLFQDLLKRETSLSEEKALRDLSEVSQNMKESIEVMNDSHNEMLQFLSSTLFISHPVTSFIMNELSIDVQHFRVMIPNRLGLLSFLETIQFKKSVDTSTSMEFYREFSDRKECLIIQNDIFDKDGSLRRNISREKVQKYIHFEVETKNDIDIDDDDLPL